MTSKPAIQNTRRRRGRPDRSQFFKDLTVPFYGANRPETDFTGNRKKIDVPTLIVHGDDDQIVPIADSSILSAKLVKGSTLKVYAGAPHGLASTHQEQFNADLLAFIKA